MKKKNGFIATSLIYSFFLIFIMLFLSVIADYLQQKVLLNSIEKGIKDDINTSMTIKDFEVGSTISFDTSIANSLVVDSGTKDFDNVKTGEKWVIANVDDVNKKIIIYSYNLYDTSSIDNLVYDNLIDIDSGNKNATYINKIIYNFDTTNSTSYNLGTNSIASKNYANCLADGKDNDYKLENNCIISGSNSYYRKRYEVEIGDKILSKESNTIDGSIVIIGV